MLKPRDYGPLALALSALLQACTTPVSVEPPKRPPLPQAAKQPPLPPACLPSCIERLTSLRERQRALLESLAAPEKPASGTTR